MAGVATDMLLPIGPFRVDFTGHGEHHASSLLLFLVVGIHLALHMAVGALDTQSPHLEDEIYVVTTGSAQFTSGDETVAVAPGTVLFVPAREDHRFHDITEDLALLVFFGPAYGTRTSTVG